MPLVGTAGAAQARTFSAHRLSIVDWGRVPYARALARQRALVDRRRAGLVVDTIVLVEHPPTVTLGRNAPPDDILYSQQRLLDRGIELVRSDRGGRATYHGPGQVVVYPIVSIASLRLGTKAWVCLLEAALLDTLRFYDIVGGRVAGRPGLWVGDRKIASVGLRIVRGISYHGVSLNVESDVSGFDCIVTCGVADQRVTSIAAESDTSATVSEVADRLCDEIATRVSTVSSRVAGQYGFDE